MFTDSLPLVMVGLLTWQGQAIGYPDDPAVYESIGVLRDAGIVADGKTLVEFFQTRVKGEVNAANLEALAKDLGQASSEVRWRAAGKLVTLGSRAVPVLRAASRDESTAAIARHCLALVEGKDQYRVPQAAAAVLGAMRTPGAVEALLAYLPYAEDPAVDSAIGAALRQMAYVDGKPDPLLMKALDDENAARQIVAIDALAQADRPEFWPRLRELLKDKKSQVRLRTAEVLLELNDASAVPVLIDLLGEVAAEPRRQIEGHLMNLAGGWAIKMPEGDDEISRKICRECWQAWWKNMDGAALLTTLRNHIPSAEEQKNFDDLLKNLNDNDAKVREQASATLVRLGVRAVAVLQREAKSKDKNRAQRAAACLKLIPDSDKVGNTAGRLCKLVALRRPEGALAALLEFAPYAPNDLPEPDILDALQAAGFVNGKFDPQLIKALENESPKRREVAAAVLMRAGGEPEFVAVRKLLKDPDPALRSSVALGLVINGDRNSVEAAIEMLSDKDLARQAEDVLIQVAGSKAPKERITDKPESNKQCREAWETWWRQHGEGVKIARPKAERFLDLLVVIQMNVNTGQGEIIEWDKDGTQRWKIEGLAFPVDAQVLPNKRVVIAEYHSNRVTERDTSGKIHWEKRVMGAPVNVQRLPNGNTFIATTQGFIECDRNGKEVLDIKIPNNYAARKLPSGQIACMQSTGVIQILDNTGKERHRFQAQNTSYTSGLDITPQGRLLVSQYNLGKVSEYDVTGKSVWEARVPNVNSATRTPKNTTLVSSHDRMKLIELDRAGKEIWTYKENTRPWRAWRR